MTIKNSPYLDRPTRSHAQFLEEEKRRQGYEYAKQENGALAGMAEMPEMLDDCEDRDFQAGYRDFYDGLKS